MRDVVEHVTVAGRSLVRPICQGDTFVHRTLKLLTSGIASCGSNRTGDAAVCASCRYVHTFRDAELSWQRLDERS